MDDNICKGIKMIDAVHDYIDECEKKIQTSLEDERNPVDRDNYRYYNTCREAALKILGKLLTIQNE